MKPLSPTGVVGTGKQLFGSVWFCNPVPASLSQPFAGGGYRLGATPEEESAYVAGERRPNSSQDVSISAWVCSCPSRDFSVPATELASLESYKA